MHVDFLRSPCNSNNPAQFHQVWLGSLPAITRQEKQKAPVTSLHHSWVSFLSLVKKEDMKLSQDFY